jgi:hypothetical protein
VEVAFEHRSTYHFVCAGAHIFLDRVRWKIGEMGRFRLFGRVSGVTDHIPNLIHHFPGAHRLCEKAALWGNVGGNRFQLPRQEDDLDLRPARTDGVREGEAIRRAGHLDVGEQQSHIGTRFKDRDGGSHVGGLDRFIACVLDDIDRAHAQQHLILDEEDDFGRCRLIERGHAGHFP